MLWILYASTVKAVAHGALSAGTQADIQVSSTAHAHMPPISQLILGFLPPPSLPTFGPRRLQGRLLEPKLGLHMHAGGQGECRGLHAQGRGLWGALYSGCWHAHTATYALLAPNKNKVRHHYASKFLNIFFNLIHLIPKSLFHICWERWKDREDKMDGLGYNDAMDAPLHHI